MAIIHSYKVLCFYVTVITFMAPLTLAVDFAGGMGEPNDPYQIATAEQLIDIGDDPNLLRSHFILVNDIDLDPNLPGGQIFTRAVVASSIGRNTGFKGAFIGRFDGNGHRVKNLTIHSTVDHLGLFGRIMTGGRVLNLGLENVTVVGTDGLRYIGGLVGSNGFGMIDCCYVTGRVYGGDNCDQIGGLVGSNSGSLSNCYTACNVSVGKSSADIGGMVGANFCSIANCYTTASVSGRDDSENIGVLVGYNSWLSGVAVNCFWDIEASGLSESAGGTGLTTAEMQDANTFLNAGWDMIDERVNGTADLWIMPGSGGYPELTVFSESFQPPPLIGAGTPEDPYEISTAEDLGAICHYDRSAYYRLVASIDLNDITWTTAPIPDFEGTFDGADFAVYNLKIHGGGHLGLFNILGPCAVVKDLGIANANVVSGDPAEEVGTLAARNWGGINNCYATGGVCGGEDARHFGGLLGTNKGSITDSHTLISVSSGDSSSAVGGLVGWNASGSITNCYATSDVKGYWEVGGLVGSNWSVITNCYATSIVSGGEISWQLGGLVGFHHIGNITNCRAICEVTGRRDLGGLVGTVNAGTITSCCANSEVNGDYGLGGLVGDIWPYGDVSNCYATGSIYSGEQGHDLGGLVGDFSRGNIANCFSTGRIYYGNESYRFGGLVGDNYKGSISNCFWDIETSWLSESAGGTGLTNAQMQTAATFLDAGWDFVGESENGTDDIWVICEGAEYPKLRWHVIPGDLDDDMDVDFVDFVKFSQRWRGTDNGIWCRGADLDEDGTVGPVDLVLFVKNWLARFMDYELTCSGADEGQP